MVENWGVEIDLGLDQFSGRYTLSSVMKQIKNIKTLPKFIDLKDYVEPTDDAVAKQRIEDIYQKCRQVITAM